MPLRKLTVSALFVALTVCSSHLIYIPIGVAKCFPIQHAVNVLLAVLLGTRYALSSAFASSLLRNLLGTGSLLAFPGSMIGAALSGILYRQTGHILAAVAGEMIGTGIIGGMLAFPVATFLLGAQTGAFFFVIPFLISSSGGSLLAYLLCRTPFLAACRERFSQ